jgi:phosphoribosylanthranilate isomerase
MPTRIKFCGCTSPGDVALAIRAGADAFGMIFAPSPRRIAWSDARAIAGALHDRIMPVGVFVNPTREEIETARQIFPDRAVQLSGEESPEFVERLDGPVFKAVHVDAGASEADVEKRCSLYPSAFILFDTNIAGTHGGTGVTFDWSKIARVARSRAIAVAGGLTPENVGECVRSTRPAWVDVRSGVETHGRKDEEKMARFVAAVRDQDAS